MKPSEIPKAVREAMLYPAEQYCRINTGFSVGGLGSLKFEFHRQLCQAIYDFLFPNGKDVSDYQEMEIHEASQSVMSFLDEQIGLPITRPLTDREATLYANKLINKLFENLDTYRDAVLKETR